MPQQDPARPELRVTLAGLDMASPVMLAAGTCGTLGEIGEVLDLAPLGAIVSKSITGEPRPGNETWRVAEDRAGMLNAIGLANPGIESFEQHYLEPLESLPTRLVVSVAGASVEEYASVAAHLAEWTDRVHAIELNVSCPNVKTGLEFGASAAGVGEVVGAVSRVAGGLPLFVKLSPVAPELHVIARSAIEAGASALTIGNTVPAMAIDVETRRPKLSNTTGGLSGPAIHPIALAQLHRVYTRVAREAGVPLIGCGGVMNWRDAAAFILAGATCVEMGTALLVDPRSPRRVLAGLSRWVKREGVASIDSLRGELKT